MHGLYKGVLTVGVACLCAGMVLADVPERVSTRLNRGDREGV